jgi:hypothetical protein
VLSPDGRWLAIEQGADIYVRPFPGVGDRSWQITTTGGTRPVWSRQGDELFHMDPAGAMVATAVRVVPRFEVGATTKLFQGQYVAMGSGHSYDVAKDRRFLMIKDAALDAIARHPTVVLNWTAELRRLVPTK